MNTDNKNNEEKTCGGHRSYYGRIYPGIWMVIIGIIFFLNNFGYLQGEAWTKLWPLFIIIPGLAMIFSPRRHY